MARIIFSTISGLPNSNKLPCFYEGLVKALAREGNDVLIIINNRLIKNHWTDNISSSNVNKKLLDRAIVDFNPDLVITANNSLYENIPTLVSCPILIYCTDSPSGFADQNALRKDSSRYHILLPSEGSIAMTREYFGTKMAGLHIIPFATDFVAQELPQTKNISFIGTNFSFAGDEFKKIFADQFDEKKRCEFIKFMKAFRVDILKVPSSYLKELKIQESLLGEISHINLLNLLSSNFRIQTLGAVADLGLSLYGSKNWRSVCDYSLDLALSYIDEEVSSVQDNQDIYNSSKVSINISHSQAGPAFSWRVRDIMACNSALVSDFRQDLVTYFGKYVKIPTYENPFEARQICQKLLQDDIWRKEIIAGSQLAIESEHRFKHRIKDIQEIIGVDLLLKKKGNIVFLNPDDFVKKSCFASNSAMQMTESNNLDCNKKDNLLKKKGIVRKLNRGRNRISRSVMVKIRSVGDKIKNVFS